MTHRLLHVYESLSAWLACHPYPPTVRELARACGLSYGNAHEYLIDLRNLCLAGCGIWRGHYRLLRGRLVSPYSRGLCPGLLAGGRAMCRECDCCHEPDHGACDEFVIGLNFHCVYCDHAEGCHPGDGPMHNGPIWPVRRRGRKSKEYHESV